MNVIEYVTEEVRRQQHDVTTLDGLSRVAYMLEAWCVALTRAEYPLDMFYVEALGKMIEPVKNQDGWRTCGVRVGSSLKPPPDEVVPRLTRLFGFMDSMTPIEFYKEFELIHPFRDGNGRTGKIILNWLNGTLLDPIFPPADLFGDPISNP